MSRKARAVRGLAGGGRAAGEASSVGKGEEVWRARNEALLAGCGIGGGGISNFACEEPPAGSEGTSGGGAVGGRLGSWSDDILRAVLSLSPLGSSYSTPKIGSKQYIRSVPKELNTDQSEVLKTAQIMGYVTLSTLVLNLKWSKARSKTAIDDLVAESMLWVDSQCEGEWEYWAPGFVLDGVAVD
ncbi:hypothetical protein V493_03541 [Pseudogymnoascus sp. VKM F-4281 (FW-2241)]|nr:hypothetical protein V493_03541 [Pseudogymnoascus sp. VKM F-4281 (FW-2241)]